MCGYGSDYHLYESLFGPSEPFGPSFLFLLDLVLQGPCNFMHRNGKQQNFLQNIFASVCIHVVWAVYTRTRWELVRGRSWTRGIALCNNPCWVTWKVPPLLLFNHISSLRGTILTNIVQVQYRPSHFGGFWFSWVFKFWPLHWPKVPSTLFSFIFIYQ